MPRRPPAHEYEHRLVDVLAQMVHSALAWEQEHGIPDTVDGDGIDKGLTSGRQRTQYGSVGHRKKGGQNGSRADL